MEHYDELGVSPTASTAEIRVSYLALARRFHPDRLSSVSGAERDRAAARMARINAAWSVLSDDTRRRAYDAVWRGDVPAGATVRDPGDSWTPFDPDDDDVDPRLLDDTPTGASSVHRGVTFLPAVLALSGAGVLLLGAILRLGVVLGAGLVLEGAAVLAFLMIPLIALANSSRADRER